MTAVRRQIVATASGREVHMRIAGDGPPVVLLHESPRSSVALMPLAERLAPRFTVVALDNPGFGGSDPLALPRPSAADYAEALAETFDALGIGRVPVYGTHTGAAIAAEFARLYPSRTAVAVLDGYPVFTPEEREELLASYLPPFRPNWDGTHVAWLWARVRDQFTFFPWNRRGPGSRLATGPFPLALLQDVVRDFLIAGDDYRAPYAAAFRYDPDRAIPQTGDTVWFTAREDDLLFPHLDRIAAVKPDANLKRLSADRDAWGAAIADIMASHGADGADPELSLADAPGATPAPKRRYVTTPDAEVLAYLDGEARGTPLVMLHDFPGGAAQLAGLAARIAGHRPVVRLDVPGCGRSRLLGDAEPDPETLGRALAAAIDTFDLGTVGLFAQGRSAPVALALAHRLDERAEGVTLLDPPLGPVDHNAFASNLPDIAPRWDGGHLAALWYMLRDDLLYAPWYDRQPASARTLDGEPDADALHARFVEVVSGGAAGLDALRRALAIDFGASMSTFKGRLDVIIDRARPDAASIEAEAARRGIRAALVLADLHSLATTLRGDGMGSVR